jgi:hypothetical protein
MPQGVTSHYQHCFEQLQPRASHLKTLLETYTSAFKSSSSTYLLLMARAFEGSPQAITCLSVEKLEEPFTFSRRCVLICGVASEPLVLKWRKKAGKTGRQPQTMPQPTSASLNIVNDMKGKSCRVLGNTYDQRARLIISYDRSLLFAVWMLAIRRATAERQALPFN